MPPICPSRRTWKRALATRQKLWRKPSGSRRKRDWSAARLRMQAVIRTRRSSSSAMRRSRIAAAAAAARALPFPFTLTGRTQNFRRGLSDLDDTIKRLKAYQAAGADALMAPGLPNLEAVRAVCAAAKKAVQLHGRELGEIVHRRGIDGRRCEAHQPRDLAVSGGYDRIAERGQGSARARHLRLHRHFSCYSRDERVPPRVGHSSLTTRRHGGRRPGTDEASVRILT